MFNSVLLCQFQFEFTMHHPHEHVSWREDFQDGFMAIPQLQTTFSLALIAGFKLFKGDIKINQVLVWDKKYLISI